MPLKANRPEAKLDDHHCLVSMKELTDCEKTLESELHTSLKQLSQLNAQLHAWMTAQDSEFLSYTFTKRMLIIQDLTKAKKLEAMLEYQMNSESKCQSQIEIELKQLKTKLQAYLPNQQDTPPCNERKRKAMKIYDIDFEVRRVLVNPKKKLYAYRIGRSSDFAKVQADIGLFPFVSFKRERVNNRHAYYIMAFICHVNILRLTRICHDKSNTTEETLMAFVEPVKGTLASLCPLSACMDSFGFIPTERCRAAFREIILGLSFLWSNGLYRGNLNWNNTYYSHKSTVKLANFEIQEHGSIEEARNIDRNSLVAMLQAVANEGARRFPHCPRDLIDTFIGTISVIDMASPIGLESSVLDNSFFWTPCQRTELFAITISIKLRDVEFVKNLPSDLCILPWTTSYGQDFIELVNAMNDYRRDIKHWSAYNENSIEHFLSCVCGAYAHKKELEVRDIDGIVTRAIPLLVEKLRRLI